MHAGSGTRWVLSITDVERIIARRRKGWRRFAACGATGWSVSGKPEYLFCGQIEFAHEKIIARYRVYPDHVRFARELFRPIAGDRIGIDFVHMSRGPA